MNPFSCSPRMPLYNGICIVSVLYSTLVYIEFIYVSAGFVPLNSRVFIVVFSKIKPNMKLISNLNNGSVCVLLRVLFVFILHCAAFMASHIQSPSNTNLSYRAVPAFNCIAVMG